MTPDTLRDRLEASPRTWLVTGVAGFIGSHLLEALLLAGQRVRGLDNFATGHQANLDDVAALVGPEAWARFTFLRGDVASLEDCRAAVQGADYVLHHAGLVSVPLSIQEPLATNRSNIDGFLNLLVACRDAGVQRVVYASSSAVYGNEPGWPKREEHVGRALSPYALTKLMNEQYAELFGRLYGMASIGLRYFNVFGRRQDPNGAYAAVIPIWVSSLLKGKPCLINGDGENTRDFCHVSNVVHANLLAAACAPVEAVNQPYNIGAGGTTTLNVLERTLRSLLGAGNPAIEALAPIHGPIRAGDVVHSRADLGRAERLLGFQPQVKLEEGLREAMGWYQAHL